MSKKSQVQVPDAWEDDWESQADKAAADPPAPEPASAPLSKRERLAQHAELNRKIWEAAQEPDGGAPLQYLATAPTPPLSQPFRPPMTVLTRKPMIAKRDPVSGAMASMALRDDSDDERDAKPQETPEEIRARQQRERDEKQRRYDEARAKIFGETSNSGTGGDKGRSGRSSGTSTPGTVTPPRSGGDRRGRGRGRGGFRGSHDRGDRGSGDFQRPNSQSGGVSLRGEGRERELYDPNYSPKPTAAMERQPELSLPGRSTPRDDQVLRAPRGPDGGGRGGFGFARRGAKEG